MSLAVRKWYEENFTTEAMFNRLKDKIETLDLSLKKPSTVFIEPIDHEQYQLTYDSCKIFCPNTNIVKTKEENISGVTLKAGDIVINELPYLKAKEGYKYKVSKEELEGLREDILKSNLQKNKDLATLLKWRLKNFKIFINRGNKEFQPPENFIDESGFFRCNDDDIEYSFSIDFNFTRCLSHKYINKEITGQGHFIYPLIIVRRAILEGQIYGEKKAFDITPQYQEYVSTYDNILDEKVVWRTLKLWEYENVDFEKITVELKHHLAEKSTYVINTVKYEKN